jgi:Immunoglobulin-like domain of bacterial spore germination
MKKLLLTLAITLAACTPGASGVIVLQSPTPNSVVASPLVVKGEAPGPWFFEANLPIELTDAEGNQIAIIGAMATEEWMTTDMVSFEGTLTFTTTEAEGFLVIRKDNPSGLPENDASEKFPVKFQ